MHRVIIISSILSCLACSTARHATDKAEPTPTPTTQEAIPAVDGPAERTIAPVPRPDLLREGEKHLKNLRQLTFGGENAEAYWSWDGKTLTLQARGGDVTCDQIYTLDLETGKMHRISTGAGRTTCSFWLPGDEKLLYASTHGASAECPAPPDYSQGYVWALYPNYDIYLLDPDGGNLRPFIQGPGYDAEATVCRDGSIVFTSTRDGDIDVYRADADGSHITRLTDEPGYDGGAFFSADCKQIVWRSSRFPTEKGLADYRALLAKNLVRPSKLEIYVMDRNGKNKRQVTKLGAASFAPYFFPDGKRIIFATNHPDPHGRNFDLYAVDVDGKNLEQITTDPSFDSFPMFSPDGSRIVFSSNRGGTHPGDTNVFLADWQ